VARKNNSKGTVRKANARIFKSS